MILLSIDTSMQACSAAVYDGGRIRARRYAAMERAEP